MLALLGSLTIVVFVVLVITKWLPVLLSLILVPVAFAFMAAFHLQLWEE